MKIIPYLMYLFLISFHETILGDLTSVGGVAFDMTILIVVLTALYKGEMEALWFGFVAGLVAGAAAPDILPYRVILTVVLSVLANFLSNRINLESIVSRLVILAGMVLINRLVITSLTSTDEIFFVLFRFILPSVLYTSLWGLIFFAFKDGIITPQKVKALF